MKQIYWLVVGSLIVALVAAVLFLLVTLKLLGDVRAPNAPEVVRDATSEELLVEERGVVCDTSALQVQAEALIQNSIGGAPDTWTRIQFEGSTEASDLYAWVNGEEVVPCEFVIAYTMPRNTEEELQLWNEAEQRIRAYLLADGWSNEASLDIQGVSENDVYRVALGHAGGPMGNTEVFVREGMEGALQFVKLTASQRWEYRSEYMEGLREDPCPCTASISLSVSGDVRLEDVIER